MKVKVLLMVGLLILAGCGSGSSLGKGGGGTESTAYSTDPQLLVKLRAELDRQLTLKGGTSRGVSAAPRGDGSRVFQVNADIQATIPDDYSQPATKYDYVILKWTHFMQGDTDGNGEVNAADLAAIARFYGQRVDYVVPQGGWSGRPEIWPPITYWPNNASPDENGSLGTDKPAQPGTGAFKWLAAAADTDHNGEINISDVSAIAAHWHERISDYRLYRRRLDHADTDGDGPDSDVWGSYDYFASVPLSSKLQYAGFVPQFEFHDPFQTVGKYRYYVRPHDSQSNTLGEFSWETGYYLELDVAPEPRIETDVTSGPAPLTVNFHANASTHPLASGDVVYSWDFDQTEEAAYDKVFSPDAADRTFTFHTPGKHTVTLWARNAENSARWMRGTTMTVNVTAAAAPGWQITPFIDGDYLVASPAAGLNTDVAGQLGSLLSYYDNSVPAYRTQFRLGNSAPVEVAVGSAQASALGMVAGKPVALLSDGSCWKADDALGGSWQNRGSVLTGGYVRGRILDAGGRPGLLYLVTGYKVDPPQSFADLEINLYYTVADDATATSWSEPLQLAEDVGFGRGFDAILVNQKPFVVCNARGMGIVSIAADDSQGSNWGPQVVISDQTGSVKLIATNPPLALLDRWEPGGTRVVLYGADASLSSWTVLKKFDYGVSDFQGGQYNGRALVAIGKDDVLSAYLATDTSNTQFAPAQIVQENQYLLDCVQLGNEPVLIHQGVDKKYYLARYGD